MNKEIIKGTIIGVISSLIASGIIYYITEILLWNYNLPVWLWLSVTAVVYLTYKLSKYLIFKRKLNNILSEFKEGGMDDSFPYTWEYKKSNGYYSVYGYEPYNINIKEETKENMSKPNTYVCGHYISEDSLKRFIQLYFVYHMNKDLRPYIQPTLGYLNDTQDSQIKSQS